jgi:hypothetical protein
VDFEPAFAHGVRGLMPADIVQELLDIATAVQIHAGFPAELERSDLRQASCIERISNATTLKFDYGLWYAWAKRDPRLKDLRARVIDVGPATPACTHVLVVFDYVPYLPLRLTLRR